MTAFWGDESWREVCYRETSPDLFGQVVVEKQSNRDIAEAFRQRLKHVAGFSHVPEPVTMQNSNRAVMYYLFFAAHKPVSQKIVGDIFDSYKRRGAVR